jgi:hypothetical protein
VIRCATQSSKKGGKSESKDAASSASSGPLFPLQDFSARVGQLVTAKVLAAKKELREFRCCLLRIPVFPRTPLPVVE